MASYSYLSTISDRSFQLLETIAGKSRAIGHTYSLEDAETIVEALNCVPPVETTETSDREDQTDSPSPVEPTVGQCPSMYMNARCLNFFGHLGDHSNLRDRWISEWENSDSES